MREWCWQILESGQGPDCLFLATFDVGDAERLARLVRAHLPAGFAIDPETGAYFDAHTLDRLSAMRAAGQVTNIWYYARIAQHDHELLIEIVLAGRSYGETEMVVALARSPELTLRRWVVGFGSDAPGEVARGDDAASLLAYLQALDEPQGGR